MRIKFRKRELRVELQKGKKTCGYPAQLRFLSFSDKINISHFERVDSSEYWRHEVFILGPESKHILLKIKVAKYNFRNCNFCILKCKESLQDSNSSKVDYFISLHKYCRYKNNAKINKRRKKILYLFIEYLNQYIFWNNGVLTTDSIAAVCYSDRKSRKESIINAIVSDWCTLS